MAHSDATHVHFKGVLTQGGTLLGFLEAPLSNTLHCNKAVIKVFTNDYSEGFNHILVLPKHSFFLQHNLHFHRQMMSFSFVNLVISVNDAVQAPSCVKMIAEYSLDDKCTTDTQLQDVVPRRSLSTAYKMIEVLSQAELVQH